MPLPLNRDLFLTDELYESFMEDEVFSNSISNWSRHARVWPFRIVKPLKAQFLSHPNTKCLCFHESIDHSYFHLHDDWPAIEHSHTIGGNSLSQESTVVIMGTWGRLTKLCLELTSRVIDPDVKLLINISGADLFILSTGWIKIKKYLIGPQEGDNWMGGNGVLCKTYYGINQVCMIASITVIAAMSLDRLYAIKYSNTSPTSVRYLIISLFIWVYSVAISWPGKF